jgi:catechol 2,3-dioxygenase-like lactoylglutathione lyase family enzyme
MLTGINHLTLAVVDLQSSMNFYKDVLGMRLRASWDRGAYLSVGEFWVCLALDSMRKGVQPDYTHYAFSVEKSAFPIFKDRLEHLGIKAWRDNTSEGESFYFFDPDGHKLEIHVGDISSRLAFCRGEPYSGMKFYE